MFSKSSRYYEVETVKATGSGSQTVDAVKLRRLPPIDGVDTTVTQRDQLDIMAYRQSDDGTRFWHIADANTELDSVELVRETGRTIQVPER